MNQTVLGHLPYSFEADPFIFKQNGLYRLFNHDLIGIKEHQSTDGIHFKFIRYHVFNALRPFIHKNILYYEKITSYLHFPFYRSHIRSRNLTTFEDVKVTDTDQNCCSPSIVDGVFFYSSQFKKMDHGSCEPTQLNILNGPSISGLNNISSLRKLGQHYLGTLIEIINGISHAKIVYCHPIVFPTLWKIGKDYITANDISPTATHVYVPTFIDNLLYVNIRFGRNFHSSEKIFVKSL